MSHEFTPTTFTADDRKHGLTLVKLHDKALTIPGKPGGSRVFHEFDDKHPSGEALVVAGRIVKVALTHRVRMAIGDDLLCEVIDEQPTPIPPDVADVLNHRAAAEAINAAAAQGVQTGATVVTVAEEPLADTTEKTAKSK